MLIGEKERTRRAAGAGARCLTGLLAAIWPDFFIGPAVQLCLQDLSHCVSSMSYKVTMRHLETP